MCTFCGNNSNAVTFKIPKRTKIGDDNTCEIGSNENFESDDCNCSSCDGCKEDNEYFSISINENRIQLGYRQKVNKLSVNAVSEVLEIKFCPWCGKELTKESATFEKSCCGGGYELTKIR